MQTLSTLRRLALHRSASPGFRGVSVGVCPGSSRWLSYLEIPRRSSAQTPEYGNRFGLVLEHSKAITESAYIYASVRLRRILCKEFVAARQSVVPARRAVGEPQQRNGRTKTIKRGTAPRADGVVPQTPAVAWHRAWRKARRVPRARFASARRRGA